MRLSGKKISSYVIERKKSLAVLQKNFFRNMKEMPRAECHIKRSTTLFINVPDAN